MSEQTVDDVDQESTTTNDVAVINNSNNEIEKGIKLDQSSNVDEEKEKGINNNSIDANKDTEVNSNNKEEEEEEVNSNNKEEEEVNSNNSKEEEEVNSSNNNKEDDVMNNNNEEEEVDSKSDKEEALINNNSNNNNNNNNNSNEEEEVVVNNNEDSKIDIDTSTTNEEAVNNDEHSNGNEEININGESSENVDKNDDAKNVDIVTEINGTIMEDEIGTVNNNGSNEMNKGKSKKQPPPPLAMHIIQADSVTSYSEVSTPPQQSQSRQVEINSPNNSQLSETLSKTELFNISPAPSSTHSKNVILEKNEENAVNRLSRVDLDQSSASQLWKKLEAANTTIQSLEEALHLAQQHPHASPLPSEPANEDFRNEIESLKNENEKLQDTNNQLKTTNDQLKEEIDQLKTKNNQLTEENNEFQKQVLSSSNDDELSKFKAESQQLEKKLNIAREQLVDIRMKNEELENSNRDLLEQCNKMETDVLFHTKRFKVAEERWEKDKKEALSNMTAKFKNISGKQKSMFLKLKATLKATQDKCEVLTKNSQQTNTALQSAHETLRKTKERLKVLEQEKSKVVAQYSQEKEKLEKEVSSEAKTLGDISSQLDDAKKQIEALTKEIEDEKLHAQFRKTVTAYIEGGESTVCGNELKIIALGPGDFSYQWRRSFVGNQFVDIVGATKDTYILSADDVESIVQCRCTSLTYPDLQCNAEVGPVSITTEYMDELRETINKAAKGREFVVHMFPQSAKAPPKMIMINKEKLKIKDSHKVTKTKAPWSEEIAIQLDVDDPNKFLIKIGVKNNIMFTYLANDRIQRDIIALAIRIFSQAYSNRSSDPMNELMNWIRAGNKKNSEATKVDSVYNLDLGSNRGISTPSHNLSTATTPTNRSIISTNNDDKVGRSKENSFTTKNNDNHNDVKLDDVIDKSDDEEKEKDRGFAANPFGDDDNNDDDIWSDEDDAPKKVKVVIKSADEEVATDSKKLGDISKGLFAPKSQPGRRRAQTTLHQPSSRSKKHHKSKPKSGRASPVSSRSDSLNIDDDVWKDNPFNETSNDTSNIEKNVESNQIKEENEENSDNETKDEATVNIEDVDIVTSTNDNKKEDDKLHVKASSLDSLPELKPQLVPEHDPNDPFAGLVIPTTTVKENKSMTNVTATINEVVHVKIVKGQVGATAIHGEMRLNLTDATNKETKLSFNLSTKNGRALQVKANTQYVKKIDTNNNIETYNCVFPSGVRNILALKYKTTLDRNTIPLSMKLTSENTNETSKLELVCNHTNFTLKNVALLLSFIDKGVLKCKSSTPQCMFKSDTQQLLWRVANLQSNESKYRAQLQTSQKLDNIGVSCRFEIKDNSVSNLLLQDDKDSSATINNIIYEVKSGKYTYE